MRIMLRSRIYSRSLVISLAILLTIVDLTQGFTLRQQQQDLEAQESTHLEVRNDLKRSNDIKTGKDGPVDIVPIQTMQQNTTRNATTSTQAAKETSERTTIDIIPTEATESITATHVMKNTIAVSTSDKHSIDLFETTLGPETTKNEDFQATTVAKNIMSENTSQRNEELDNTVLPTELSEIMNTVTDIDTEITTTEFTEQSTEAQLHPSTLNEKIYDITETEIMKDELTTVTDKESKIMMTPTGFKMAPAWKKYTTILRNRVDNTEKGDTPATTKFGDSINAHTTESRITLEKAFDLSPDIQSLQDLKNNLMETANTMQTFGNLETTKTIVSQTDATPTTTVNLTANEKATKVEGIQTEIVSMRAGFLDHSKMLSTGAPTATTNSSNRREFELDGISYETDLPDSDGVEHKSHSQLAEDAMKEELLKESLINDKEVNSIRYRPTTTKENATPHLDVITLKLVPDLLPVTEATVPEQKIVDELSVKPISSEKKNTNLYTVSPNYKPLKKIDVQPPKPFTRDPDDNSWRNESLTSLGIVFKAKNASKAFTEVLKNKTETVMNNLPELNKTIEKYELRDRLEKIAEKRKSKKKKVDKFGNTEYTDYEENNNSGDTHTSKETPVDAIPSIPSVPFTSTEVSTTEATTMPVPVPSLITDTHPITLSTEKPKKSFNLQDYYDATDEDDYATLPNVDIMKSTPRPRVQWPVTSKIVDDTTSKQYLPERKPTVQYFPPLPKQSPDVSVDVYDTVFKKRVHLYNSNTRKPAPDNTRPLGRYTGSRNYPESSFRDEKAYPNDNRSPIPIQHVQYTPVDVANTVYLTEPPKAPPAGYEPEGYSRGFIVRHYKDLLDAAIKDNDYDRSAFLLTESPVTGVTDDARTTVKYNEYEYEQRKEALDKFVDNFNQNHERFEVDFPVLFNSSIVHKHGQDGGKVLASSSATFKRLYDATANKANGFLFSSKPFDPNCENITVELSPAYELHYYVPDHEEREEAAKVTVPYGYRL